MTAVAPSDHSHDLVEDHLSLARAIAHKYGSASIDDEDLAQVACLALVKAARRYDPAAGEFAPFASATIHGELKRHLRDASWRVRPPRPVQELVLRLRADGHEHGTATTRATRQELAARYDVTTEEVAEAFVAGDQGVDSIDRLLDVAADRQELLAVAPRQGSEVEDRLDLRAALRSVSARERTLLRLYYVDELTQDEIARRMDVSQMTISRWMRRAVEVLRAELMPTPQAA